MIIGSAMMMLPPLVCVAYRNSGAPGIVAKHQTRYRYTRCEQQTTGEIEPVEQQHCCLPADRNFFEPVFAVVVVYLFVVSVLFIQLTVSRLSRWHITNEIFKFNPRQILFK